MIDEATFARLRQNMGDDFVGELCAAYQEEAPKLLAQIHDALARGDAALLGRAAHTLKFYGANFGASGLYDVCKQLEDTGRGGAATATSEQLARLAGEERSLGEALRAFRDRLPGATGG